LTALGIVGSEGAKFTTKTEGRAKRAIEDLILNIRPTKIVSGACHLGGIDKWAAEFACFYNIPLVEYAPRTLSWSSGYKPRNMQIARASDIVVCITLDRLPPTYSGMRFNLCYHCGTKDHVKSGGCWTVKQARRLGKEGRVIVVSSD
jgi:hypothetical protein